MARRREREPGYLEIFEVTLFTWAVGAGLKRGENFDSGRLCRFCRHGRERCTRFGDNRRGLYGAPDQN